MTLFDALRILELATPITPEGLDRAGHTAMQRLEDIVRRSPADTDLTARALACADEVRAAYAFLRERPAHLYPYHTVAPSAEQHVPPALGASTPPLAFQAPTPVPAASPTEAAQADGLLGPAPAMLPGWGTATQARSTPPPLPRHPAPIAPFPAESSRCFPSWQMIMVWSALIIACGVGIGYGVLHFHPSGKPAPGGRSGLSAKQPEPAVSAPSGGLGVKPAITAEAAALRGISTSDAPPGTASDGGSSRRLVVKTAPDGTVVANTPDGSTFRQSPGGNRVYSYGPKGSPFGNNAPADRARGAPATGASVLRKATKQGGAEAQYLQAKTLIFPPSPPSDAPEGLRLLEKAASQNHLMAGYTLACTYLDGIGRPAAPEKGVSMLRSLTANRTFPLAAIRLADCHRDGLGVPCDYDHALSVYRHWETLPCAQYRISLMYQYGCGVDKDDVEALKWLQVAVAASHSPALYQMGLRYAKGKGVPQDEEKAAEAYGLAARLGYAPAQAALGRCYQGARGVPFESGLAIHYFQQAALQGFPHAQDYLGSSYAEGNCIWKDPVQASGWYAKAAAQGYGPAQMHLGRFLLEDHPGLPADPVRALAWFIRAESQEVEDAAEMVHKTRKQLSRQDIAAAERAASQLPRTPAWNHWQPFSP